MEIHDCAKLETCINDYARPKEAKPFTGFLKMCLTLGIDPLRADIWLRKSLGVSGPGIIRITG